MRFRTTPGSSRSQRVPAGKPSACRPRVDRWQGVDDALEREAIEAVATDASLADRPGERQGMLHRRHVAVEGRLETCHLRQLWPPLSNGLDREEALGLSRWRQRNQRL
jgi:hypothetical protein